MKYFKKTQSFLFGEPGIIPGTTGSNSIIIKNEGNVNVIINDAFKLAPGDSLSSSESQPEVYDYTQYKVRFTSSNGYTSNTPLDLTTDIPLISVLVTFLYPNQS